MLAACLIQLFVLFCFAKACSSRVGIANLGNTCYMNSVLQSLYHIDEFRDRLESTNDASAAEKLSVAKALLKIFEELDSKLRPASAKALVQLCEVNPFIQEDAQEFLLKLFEKIDRESNILSKASPTDVFAGEMVQYIRCKHVNVTKERRENFFDLSVDVMDAQDLLGALDKLFTPDELEGSNQYKTSEYGLQDASKGQYISKLPHALYVHLKRFTYDFDSDKMSKVRLYFYII